MRTIPPELTSSALTALALLGTWFATWLARKGKREDTRIAQTNQTFTQLRELGEARLAEIIRLTAALTEANAALERLRTEWENRWDRQMKRCREITDGLVRGLAALRHPGEPTPPEVDDALRDLDDHRATDHEG